MTHGTSTVTGRLGSVNIGAPRPNPFKAAESTGIAKHPVDGPVLVRDPGPRTTGLGSGLVGDFIGDVENHGGRDQAVYAFAREDLDAWAARLDRDLPDGSFGENLTTRGLDVNAAVLGERWRIGDTVELVVTVPRLPCATFRGWMELSGWLRTFTLDARPGAYLRVDVPGEIRGGDEVTVVHRPQHGVTVTQAFRALTTDRDTRRDLLAAGDDLVADLADHARS
ncbi:MOSC domain-containing protein [uncultured Jatrophihabitans sp.]|uniref:MOSC domain-containing protein n=1 Tax=uncultured Jatrophihabitans sp. TaxID=1610747 RepID=UPI0035CBA521